MQFNVLIKMTKCGVNVKSSVAILNICLSLHIYQHRTIWYLSGNTL